LKNLYKRNPLLKIILNLLVRNGIDDELQQSSVLLPIMVISQFSLLTVPAIFNTLWSKQMQFITEKVTLFLAEEADMRQK